MSLLNRNLNFLKKSMPGTDELVKNSSGRVVIEPSKSGLLTMKYRADDNEYYIHSKFHPINEAVRSVADIDSTADHFVVLGIGLGYHITVLAEKVQEYARILIIEPDPEIFAASLNTVDWEYLFNNKNISLYLNYDLSGLPEAILDFIAVSSFEKMEFLELSSLVRFNQTYYQNVRASLEQEIKAILYDFQTRLAERSMVGTNVLKNLPWIFKSKPVNSLKDRFKGVPGFIVSAGPSLDRDIRKLKKIDNRGIIICVDTALKPLLKNGIQPHFTAAIDPSYKNYLHLMNTEEEFENFVIAETGVASQIFKDYEGRIFTSNLGKPLMNMIESTIGEIGQIDAWGSVISMALNLAVYMGLNPVTFIGQDFAFTDMRNHCRHTSWEENWLEYYRNRLGDLQRMETLSIGGIAQVREEPDVYGNKTLSSDKLLLYKNYLARMAEEFRDTEIFNSSDGGVFTEIPHIPLTDFIRKYIYKRPAVDFSVTETIPRIRTKQKEIKLIKFLDAKHAFFRKYLSKTEKLISKLEELHNADQISNDLTSIMEEAEKLKNSLYQNMDNGELVEMWSQAPIFTYLRKTRSLNKQNPDENYIKEVVEITLDYFTSLKPLLTSIVDSFKAAVKEIKAHSS